MRVTESHLARAAVATSWNYGGRLLGLGWTALLIYTLGIDDYGRYAIGIAAAAIINAAIDNAFHVRSLRVDDEHFQRERCARVLFGSAVGGIGVAAFPQFYVVGFAVIVAAGELLFNTFKSQYVRAGRPDVAMRFDAGRQFTSIGLAAGYLVVADDPQLSTATALYVAPYLVVMLACLRFVPGRRPARPGGLKEISLLSTEAFAAAIYAQGDVLVLGALAGDEVTGYYSVAVVTALAVSTIGQQYANTFVAHLRASGGDRGSAAAPRSILTVGLFTGLAMLTIGIGILLWGRADYVGYLILAMSPWVAARAIQYNFVVILFAQRRDALRVRATAAAAAAKAVLLFPMIHLMDAYGAAMTAVACEIGLISVYYYMIYRRSTPTGPDHGDVATDSAVAPQDWPAR